MSQLEHWLKTLIERILSNPFRLFVAGAIAVMLSSTIEYYFPEGSSLDSKTWLVFTSIFWVHFFRDLGIAFWVAVAIAVAIEKIAMEKRNKEIENRVQHVQENALAAVFNSNMPNGWLKYIRDVLQDNKFYRYDVTVTYTIRELNDSERHKYGDGFCIYNSTIKSRVENRGAEPDIYTSKLIIEKPWNENLNELVKIEYILINGALLSDEELEKANNSPDELMYQFEKIINIQLESGQSKELEVRFQGVRYPTDTTTWTSFIPSSSLDVTLKAPKNYRVRALMRHPSADKENRGEGLKIGDSEVRVSTRSPCFPFTVVELSWTNEPSRTAEPIQPPS